MIIGVLSDTHRNRQAVDRAFRFFKAQGAGLVIHLGDLCSDIRDKDIEYDLPVVCVAGNLDGAASEPYERVYSVAGVNLFLAHGHTLAVRFGQHELVAKAKGQGCSVALYGHTHIPFNARENGVLVLNPGSAAEPRGGSRASVALLIIGDGEPQATVYWLDELDEIGPDGRKL